MIQNNNNSILGLTSAQLSHFSEKGWVCVDLYTPDEVAVLRDCLEKYSGFITDANHQKIMTFYNNVYQMETPRDLHLYHKPLADIFKSEKLIHKIIDVGGPDLLLWYTNVFCKLPKQGEIKWHQAIEYYTSSDFDAEKKTLIYDEADEPVNLTVWVAVDEADQENGCMRFANGSHHTKFEVIPSAQPASEGIFSGIGAHNTVWQLDNRYSFAYKFDESEWETEYVPMQPGQAIIFTERTMHCSSGNDSERRRMGIIGRYVRPSTVIYPGRLSNDMIDENGHDISRHYNIQVAGTDAYQRNVIRDDHDLDEIENRFQEMFNLVRFGLVSVPEDMTQLQIKALEQQAIEGDCDTEQPNPILYPKKFVHWQSWNDLRGTSRQEAMQRYNDIVAELPAVSEPGCITRASKSTSLNKLDQTEIESWLIAYLADALDIASNKLEVDVPLMQYGLASVEAARMIGDLSDWMEAELDPALAYDHPTIESLAQHLTAQ